MRIENSDAREWYLKESADQNWSTRVLERQMYDHTEFPLPNS